ncbi:hypothetical protein Glove_97g69 [Diversispora epigaea]|uniref:Uncharacterized protein n=1 Tax=Diversispora epigaea TaxID=1348612 RepID=A0A397JBI7_9GLOM|nr:hypothetical protein Glove_97g69 [Diversispora epigaea]
MEGGTNATGNVERGLRMSRGIMACTKYRWKSIHSTLKISEFEGISVLLIGDPYQLPPVNIDKISSVEKFFPLFLTTCHCQQTDSTFYQEKLRIGTLNPQTKLVFKSDETDKIFYHYTNYLTEVAFVIFLNNSLGISVLLIGDPYQLPPVNIDKISSVEKFFPLFLTTCHCQQTDSTFYQEKLRIGTLNPQTKLASIRESFEECGIQLHHYTPQDEIDQGMFCLFANKKSNPKELFEALQEIIKNRENNLKMFRSIGNFEDNYQARKEKLAILREIMSYYSKSHRRVQLVDLWDKCLIHQYERDEFFVLQKIESADEVYECAANGCWKDVP